VARLVLAIGFFVAINQYRYVGPADPQTATLLTAFILFLIAAFTDFLDGYLARRWQVVSLFGRIVDPVADKLLILGAFIYLAGPRFMIPGSEAEQISGVYPWMVIVILLRELGVTSIRAAMESRGIDFSAKSAGKWKMILQVVAVPTVLGAIWLEPGERAWVAWTRDIVVWATVIVTILSGLPYITGAMRAASHENKT